MFILVILGYFVVVVLACCGIAETVQAVSLSEQSMGIYAFLKSISTACMPLAVALILLALLQCCKFLESIAFFVEQKRLSAAMSKSTQPRAKKQEKKDAPASFFGDTSDAPSKGSNPTQALQAPIIADAPSSQKEPEKEASDGMSFFHVN